MSWHEEKYEQIREAVWEHVDALVEAGVTALSPSAVWRSLPFYGPTEYNACIHVLTDGVKAGIFEHSARGLYLLRGATEIVWPPTCRHGKTGSHYNCKGPTKLVP